MILIPLNLFFICFFFLISCTTFSSSFIFLYFSLILFNKNYLHFFSNPFYWHIDTTTVSTFVHLLLQHFKANKLDFCFFSHLATLQLSRFIKISMLEKKLNSLQNGEVLRFFKKRIEKQKQERLHYILPIVYYINYA